ncbi:HNH endonuclease [Streptomyces sp. JB150]|nr:HNH endonuclease [Streptomyces sp. JB150]
MAATVRAAEAQRPKPKRKRKNRRPLPPSLQGSTRETRLYLAERDGWQCFYCRRPFERLDEATTDHYVPRSLWACNLPANLVLACEPCNRAKDDRLTWSMAALLLAWEAGEGGAAGDGNGALGAAEGPPARRLPASLTA